MYRSSTQLPTKLFSGITNANVKKPRGTHLVSNVGDDGPVEFHQLFDHSNAALRGSYVGTGHAVLKNKPSWRNPQRKRTRVPQKSSYSACLQIGAIIGTQYNKEKNKGLHKILCSTKKNGKQNNNPDVWGVSLVHNEHLRCPVGMKKKKKLN